MDNIKTISDLLTFYFKDLIDTEYNQDKCKPTFSISLLDEKLLLTVTHLGWSHSGVIGFETNINDLFVTLYNKTM